MTNREWVNTLSDEEFVEWALSNYESVYYYTEDGQFAWLLHPQSYSPTITEIVSSSTNSMLRLKEWLNEEREEYEKFKNTISNTTTSM